MLQVDQQGRVYFFQKVPEQPVVRKKFLQILLAPSGVHKFEFVQKERTSSVVLVGLAPVRCECLTERADVVVVFVAKC